MVTNRDDGTTFNDPLELVLVMQSAVPGLVINGEIMKENRYNDIFSAEEANRMVLRGTPF
ncbi:MAG: hypothetical protein IH593_13715, partial [Bacteroidales bacterium]|nr:hypothetical protein [Bacteroidales bacterium]